MAGMIYALCALTAALCTWQLLRAYRVSRYRLLLWGGLCFAGLTLNGILLVADKLYAHMEELSFGRMTTALLSMAILLYGLIWDME